MHRARLVLFPASAGFFQGPAELEPSSTAFGTSQPLATAAKDGRSRLESGRWRSDARWLPECERASLSLIRRSSGCSALEDALVVATGAPLEATLGMSLLGTECLMQKGLEQVIGLAEGFGVNGSQFIRAGDEVYQLLLVRN